MPGSAGSSWYFLRYIDPNNDHEIADKKLLEHWMPVDLYVGGPEHAVGHLLYSRMWNHYLYDKGITPFKEPFKKLVHQGMILGSNGEKMSKSNGEFLGMEAIRSRGFDPMAYKYLVLLSHFQAQLAFSWEGLESASNGYKNIVKKLAALLSETDRGAVDKAVYDTWHDKMLSTISDNMKTAETLVIVQDLLKSSDINSATKIALFEFVDRLLGLQFIDRANRLNILESEIAPAEVQALADARIAAKSEKNWALADELRAQIDAAGWSVVDTKEGAKLVKKS